MQSKEKEKEKKNPSGDGTGAQRQTMSGQQVRSAEPTRQHGKRKKQEETIERQVDTEKETKRTHREMVLELTDRLPVCPGSRSEVQNSQGNTEKEKNKNSSRDGTGAHRQTMSKLQVRSVEPTRRCGRRKKQEFIERWYRSTLIDYVQVAGQRFRTHKSARKRKKKKRKEKLSEITNEEVNRLRYKPNPLYPPVYSQSLRLSAPQRPDISTQKATSRSRESNVMPYIFIYIRHKKVTPRHKLVSDNFFHNASFKQGPQN